MTTELIDPAQDAPQRSAVQAASAAIPQQPLSVIEQAIRTGATADQLERLLQLQVQADHHRLDLMREKRRMDEEDRKAAALLSFRRDFAAFRGENIVVAKNKHVDRGRAGSFMQAEYHSIAQLLSPALSRHGFGFRHDQKFGPKPWPLADNPGNVVGWVWVTCFLEHKDGHVETLELEGPEGDQSANTPVQNMQLTASYLKRQSLLAITGTATGGEDDESAMRNKQRRPAQQSAGDDQSADDGDALLDAGRDQAMRGMKALTAWWGGLTAKQRSAMNGAFGALRRGAMQADQGGAQ
jgi:hypothetical protein